MIIETGIHILNKITRKQNFVDCRFILGGTLRAFGRCGQPAGYRNSYTIQTKTAVSRLYFRPGLKSILYISDEKAQTIPIYLRPCNIEKSIPQFN
jgi:hypothetical protein